MAKKHENRTDILEEGDIYFFYRPKVQEEEPEGESDVQRFYLILHPSGKSKYRLVVIGQKNLPAIKDGGERNWGAVMKVARSPNELKKELEEQKYRTKTRGERVRPAARAAGEGLYALVNHSGHTHLAYELELPQKAGAVQQALEIEKQGSYILSIKNPEKPSPRRAGLGEEQKADFPQRLREKFRGRRFVAADPSDFLDYEGAEILLIGAKEKPEEELGIEFHPEDEDERSAEIFRDLKIRREKIPVEPLFQGSWT